MQLCDAHCHLQDARLADVLETVLKRAREAGLAAFVCCGSAEDDWEAVARLAAAQADVVPCYGLHPWFVSSRGTGWLAALRARLVSDPRAGVGEVGLDHAIEVRDDREQADVLRAQLTLARELDRPVSIHCRRAWGALLDMLRDFGPFAGGLVFHSYSGAAELIPELTELGGRFSFSGSVTFSNNKRAHRAVAAVPADRLLIETDAPDLHPNSPPRLTDVRGRPVNEPANLVRVLGAVAAARGETRAAVAARTWRNAAALFDLGGAS